jgi:hypothetical protein
MCSALCFAHTGGLQPFLFFEESMKKPLSCRPRLDNKYIAGQAGLAAPPCPPPSCKLCRLCPGWAVRASRRTRLRETSAMRYRLLCALVMMFASHAPPCSLGNTPLKQAIKFNQHDVLAFLRSVGAPE